MGTSDVTSTDSPRLRFQPAVLPSLAALVGLLLTGYLGQWQQGRAVEKRALQANFDARIGAVPIEISATPLAVAAHVYRRAAVVGQFEMAGQLLIDNKSHQGAVGYHVVTPLRVKNTETWVLVNRGWIARSKTYPIPPRADVPSGEVAVSGMLVVPSTKFLELSKDVVAGNVWQNLTVERYRQASGRVAQPLILLADRDVASGLVPVAERPDARVEKHVEYMLTWYSLAATIIAIWVVLNLKIDRKASSE